MGNALNMHGIPESQPLVFRRRLESHCRQPEMFRHVHLDAHSDRGVEVKVGIVHGVDRGIGRHILDEQSNTYQVRQRPAADLELC